ncbi:MAG TPA: scyllo-inosose 3-dehydrogenase [Anaerolineae bacterium]|nr:scyllo-inosose 3-dehydrogenase [Anaerolineae bacterium]
MNGKMRGVTLCADWDPRPGFKLGPKDIEGKQTYLGSRVWRNPRIEMLEYDIPKPGPREVVLEVKACGICGSDVHMAQADDEGYTWYPGLTGFPAILGHEVSGMVVDWGSEARDKVTNKPFKGGERVCTEEMIWCGECKPCADGYPNHCERLDEIGINTQGGFAKYLVVPARTLWSLEPLADRYPGDELFVAGSLVEPTSVAYNAVVERGGGIRPGDNVVICGGGPVGMAACAIMKRMGAQNVIISEPQKERAELGLTMGADYAIDPTQESFVDRVLELTDGMGANLYLEASGLPTIVYPQIEQAVWEGRALNAMIVVLARADAKMPVTGEVLQVRRAGMVGAQGHSGHGTFARVIASMADGMDMTQIVTKRITLDQVKDNIIMLRDDRKECKITCVDFD